MEVDKGMPADIKCLVDATPLTNSTLKWNRKDFDFGKLHSKASNAILKSKRHKCTSKKLRNTRGGWTVNDNYFSLISCL